MLGPHVTSELESISKRLDKLLKSNWHRGNPPYDLTHSLELLKGVVQAEKTELRRRKKEIRDEERNAKDIQRALDLQRGIIQ